MFGKFTTTQGSKTVVFEAFMENDGEFTITTEVDGVETNRVVIKEGPAYALADLIEREERKQPVSL